MYKLHLGKLVPNDVDRQITRKIKETSKILDIALVDHLIIIAELLFDTVPKTV